MKTKHSKSRPQASARPHHFSAPAFWARQPIFTLAEFRAEHAKTGASMSATSALLRHHVEAGQLDRIRRGLFAVPGFSEPLLIASCLAPDAVLAYDAALSFHRVMRLVTGLSVLTWQQCQPFEFDALVIRAVRPPQNLKRKAALVEGVETHSLQGRTVRVTCLERTFVDGLDRLDLVPSLWELLCALRDSRKLDVGAMVHHAEALGHALTAARLGVTLELLQLGSRAHLTRLESLAPRSNVYFDTESRAEPTTFHARWNLMVPSWLTNGLRGQVEPGPQGPPSRRRW